MDIGWWSHVHGAIVLVTSCDLQILRQEKQVLLKIILMGSELTTPPEVNSQRGRYLLLHPCDWKRPHICHYSLSLQCQLISKAQKSEESSCIDFSERPVCISAPDQVKAGTLKFHSAIILFLFFVIHEKVVLRKKVLPIGNIMSQRWEVNPLEMLYNLESEVNANMEMLALLRLCPSLAEKQGAKSYFLSGQSQQTWKMRLDHVCLVPGLQPLLHTTCLFLETFTIAVCAVPWV